MPAFLQHPGERCTTPASSPPAQTFPLRVRLYRMAKARAVAAHLALALTLAAGARAASDRDRLLVSTDWLAAHLHDPALVLLHVGDAAEFAAGHLPGARFVALKDVSAGPSGAGDFAQLRLEMLPADELRPRLERLGISDDSRIVVYFGKDWVSPATRLLFTLDYAGLGANASLLDGGQPAWVRDGHAVTTETVVAAVGKLSPLRLRGSIVDARFVREHRTSPGFALVDARDADFYNGVETGGAPEHPHRTGHIAGARSLPFDTTTTDDLHLRSGPELQERFAAAGVSPGDTIVVYCHIGQQATAVLFAARTLGRDVRLYDGSFEEWSRLPAAEYPVEAPAGAPKAAEKPVP